MGNRRVLIAGASIAGPALAYWLRRYGGNRRSSNAHPGAARVDRTSTSAAPAERWPAGWGSKTTSAPRRPVSSAPGSSIVTDRRSLSSRAGRSDSGGATAELEIPARRPVPGSWSHRPLTTSSTATATSSPGSTTTAAEMLGSPWGFEHGRDEQFDLVVAADGIGSSTRGLVFGDEVIIRPLGLETTWATIPRTEADDNWWRWCGAPGGRSMTLRTRPDRDDPGDTVVPHRSHDPAGRSRATVRRGAA